MKAHTRRRPLSIRQLSSDRRSSDNSSTREAKVKRPADMAFITPTRMSPTSDSGLYADRAASPMA